MARVLIFEKNVGGHHLEYLHHIYIAAGQRNENEYIFALPESFKIEENDLEWPLFENIKIYSISLSQLSKLTGNHLVICYRLSKLLKNLAKKMEVDKVIVLSLLMQFVPLLPLILSSKYKVRGIVYTIFFYRLNSESFLMKILYILKYYILSKCSVFEIVYILNDYSSARLLNQKFYCSKFTYLPDPYVNVNVGDAEFRKNNGIKIEQKLFIHFGTLSKRKGTIEILKSMQLLSDNEKEHYVFLFAGKVKPEIKREFYQIIEWLRIRNFNVFVFDEFCSFTFIGTICKACDAILIPYKNTAQSSGLLGYAAQFNKPLLAPSNGLIGKLVNEYKLGYLLDNLSPRTIADNLDKVVDFSVNGRDYLEQHKVIFFTERILNI